jgi:curved DNA binding protein
MILNTGDVVKIDFGVHIDGFIAGVAHTVVVGASKENKITGRKADVLLAAYYAAEIAQRLVKPGNNNNQVTEIVNKVAKEFNCTPVEGMLSHQVQQDVIAGEKTIIQNPSEAQGKDHKKCEFELHECYGVDVLISSGDGKAKEHETRTTVYKRTDLQYALKMKASRAFYSEVCNKFTMMPFTLRAFEDEKKARLGVGECTNHELLTPYPVLYEKDGEYVAQTHEEMRARHEQESSARDAVHQKLMSEVDTHHEAMVAAHKAAAKAHANQDFHKIKDFKAQATQHKENKKTALDKAMDEMFKHSNQNPDGTWIDLHGLQVAYAEKKTKEFLQTARGNSVQKVEVITGAGNHSGKGGPKIKIAIQKMFNEMGLDFESSEGHHGSFIVHLQSSAS